MADIYETLLGSLSKVTNQEEFERRSGQIIEAVFQEVFNQARQGKLVWSRTPHGLRGELVANSITQIAIPELHPGYYGWPYITLLLLGEQRTGFSLWLGNIGGPSRHSKNEERVRELVRQVFGV